MSKSRRPDRRLSAADRAGLVAALQARFEKHPRRHPGIAWEDVRERLDAAPAKLTALHAMESTGGEPDVVGRDETSGEILFVDCSEESPKGRRSACYDRAAQQARKEARPEHNAVDLAAELGIELLTEEQYRRLQELGELDSKTSSWVQTPADVRELGGALFCDRRYGRVFVYHSGAQSYYAARGFRGMLRV